MNTKSLSYNVCDNGFITLLRLLAESQDQGRVVESQRLTQE